jgi:thioredoxin reductase-like selenoprotein T
MRNNFLGLKSFVESKFPQFLGNIHGEVYPPPAVNVMIATLAGYIWFIGIALTMGGNQIFGALGMPVPDIVKTMNENKVPTFMTLFVINSLGNSLIATGAFEIYVNDQLIFSKLQTGRFPNGEELVQLINTLGYQVY